MANIDRIGSISRYKNSLANVCLFASRLEQYAEDKENGKKVREKDVIYTATMLKQYKQFLLTDKAMLGFNDGLSFMENNKFRGYEIKDGRFYGDRSLIKGIVYKWIEGFPDTANNYQYEVSMLTLALAFPEEIEALKKAA